MGWNALADVRRHPLFEGLEAGDHVYFTHSFAFFPRDAADVAARADRVTATDDAALCEQLGHDVVVVRGSERAMKVTEEADFVRVEALFPLPE
jgi:hypothetical protein